MSFSDELERMGACREGVEWAGDRTLEEIWRDCERGDWLIWLAGKCGVAPKLLVRSACACARLSLVHIPSGEERPRVAIETAERWCSGDATIEEVRVAANAAKVAYSAAWAAWLATGHNATAYSAAWATAAAAVWAADGHNGAAAAWAAEAAAAAAAAWAADAVRSVITFEVIEKTWGD